MRTATIGRSAWDLDGFKRVNDSLGHAAGDELLKTAAERLRGALREGDTVARLGGDEFAVILPNVASSEDCGMVAQKLLDCLTAPVLLAQRESVTPTASIGITLYPSDAASAAVLLRNADLASQGARQNGRGRCHFFTAKMNADLERRFALEKDLRGALERNEFELHYQPQSLTGRDQLTGVEALLRWRRAGDQLVPPSVFIPALEDTGMIRQVGAWVIREACRQAAEWLRQGLGGLRVAVNVSAQQLHDGGLSESVRDALQSAGCAARLLELEVTESMMMRDLEASVDALKAVRAMGVQIAVDDFGTGHSSLSYLKKLPIDVIKIDRSFVRDIVDDADDAEICTAITQLAHALGYRVIAEGVETVAQRHLLRLQGCDEFQGFLLGRPMPPAEFARWARTRGAGAGLKEVA
jgi:diguanylate cyclase (GGDEF)-like protein